MRTNFQFKSFLNKILKLYLTTIIKSLYVLTENTIVYGVYVFVVLCTFYGDADTNLHFIFSIIVFFVFANSFLVLVLCKIPFLRDFLDNLLGKQFVLDYLGEYSGLKRFVKASVPIVAATVADIVTQQQNVRDLAVRNKLLFDNADNVHKKVAANEWNKKDGDALLKQQTDLIKNTDTSGAVSKAIKNSEISDTVKSISKDVADNVGNITGVFRGR